MRKRSLLSSFRTLFIMSSSISFLIVAIIFSTIYNHRMSENNVSNITNTLNSLCTGMKIYISELNSIANVPYYDNNVFNTMVEINNSSNINKDLSINEMPAGRNYRIAFVKYMYNSSQIIDGVTFYPYCNSHLASYSLNRNIAKTNINTEDNYQNSDWYASLSKDPLTPVFCPEYDENGILSTFSYAKSIRDIDTKEIIGYLKVCSSANSFTRLMSNIDVGKYSALCLVTSQNDIVFLHTNDNSLSSCHTISSLSDSIRGTMQLVSVEIPDTNMKLVYLISNRELFVNQLTTYCIVLLIIFISALLAFTFYQYQAKRLTATIVAIQDKLSYVSNGHLVPMDISPKESELQDIVSSIDQMIHKLNEYIIKEYKANLMQQEAEYRALQAQINPHFLYNTLNGFIGLNRMGEKQLLESSIINLTHLFQYTCNSATHVPLETEVTFIEQYLALQTLKYDNRLTYQINIDERTKYISIPKLLLQPLIENSIIHGLEPTSDLINIQIFSIYVVTSFGPYSVIILTDNGVGFSVKELAGNKRIGLENTRKRLQYDNPENIFQILSEPSKGTTCLLLLKLPKGDY